MLSICMYCISAVWDSKIGELSAIHVSYVSETAVNVRYSGGHVDSSGVLERISQTQDIYAKVLEA